MRKPTSCILLCVLLVCCALFAASAEQVSGSYAYTLRDDGTAQIVRYTGEEADLAIPDKLDGIAVTAIGPSAFHKNDTLQTLRIPEGQAGLRRHTVDDRAGPVTELGANPGQNKHE